MSDQYLSHPSQAPTYWLPLAQAHLKDPQVSREQLRQEGRMFDKLAASAREKSNTMLSIFRLGPEVMSLIFSILRDDTTDLGDNFRDDSRLWAAITQVSRWWRSISLGYAPLWTMIHLTHRTSNVHFHDLLSRSKASPLTVKFDWRIMSSGDLFIAGQSLQYLTEHHSDRFRALQIRSRDPEVLVKTLSVNRPYHNLQVLICYNDACHSRFAFHILDSARNMPALATLYLSGFDIDPLIQENELPSVSFPNLVDFCFACGYNEFEPGPGIFDLLRVMPSLQTLRILNDYPSPAHSHHADTVTLPETLSQLLISYMRSSQLSDYCIAFVRKLEHGNTPLHLLVSPETAPSLIEEFFGPSKRPHHIFLDLDIIDSEKAVISSAGEFSPNYINAPLSMSISFGAGYPIDHDPEDEDLENLSFYDLCRHIFKDELVSISVSAFWAVGGLEATARAVWTRLHGPQVTVVNAIGLTSISSLLIKLAGSLDGTALYRGVKIFKFQKHEFDTDSLCRLPSFDFINLLGYACARCAENIPIISVEIWPGALEDYQILQLQEFISNLSFVSR